MALSRFQDTCRRLAEHRSWFILGKTVKLYYKIFKYTRQGIPPVRTEFTETGRRRVGWNFELDEIWMKFWTGWKLDETRMKPVPLNEANSRMNLVFCDGSPMNPVPFGWKCLDEIWMKFCWMNILDETWTNWMKTKFAWMNPVPFGWKKMLGWTLGWNLYRLHAPEFRWNVVDEPPDEPCSTLDESWMNYGWKPGMKLTWMNPVWKGYHF